MWRLPLKRLAPRCRPRPSLIKKYAPPQPFSDPSPITFSLKVPLVPAVRHFCSSPDVKPTQDTEDLELEEQVKVLEQMIRQELAKGVPGTRAEEAYAIALTCKVCDQRSIKKISKRAYHHGVVIITCPQCQNRHLIADRLEWFQDGGTDIEQMMKEKGEKAVKLVKYRLNCPEEDALKALEELVHVEAAEAPPPIKAFIGFVCFFGVALPLICLVTALLHYNKYERCKHHVRQLRLEYQREQLERELAAGEEEVETGLPRQRSGSLSGNLSGNLSASSRDAGPVATPSRAAPETNYQVLSGEPRPSTSSAFLRPIQPGKCATRCFTTVSINFSFVSSEEVIGPLMANFESPFVSAQGTDTATGYNMAATAWPDFSGSSQLQFAQMLGMPQQSGGWYQNQGFADVWFPSQSGFTDASMIAALNAKLQTSPELWMQQLMAGASQSQTMLQQQIMQRQMAQHQRHKAAPLVRVVAVVPMAGVPILGLNPSKKFPEFDGYAVFMNEQLEGTMDEDCLTSRLRAKWDTFTERQKKAYQDLSSGKPR
eukprot:s23_g27.t1